jgi:hypothetical protein
VAVQHVPLFAFKMDAYGIAASALVIGGYCKPKVPASTEAEAAFAKMRAAYANSNGKVRPQ